MTDPSDHDLGLDRDIPRRDFLNGVLWSAAAAATPLDRLVGAGSAEPYPPALTGLRGSTDASFDAAHKLRDEKMPPEWATPRDTGEKYDLVVVGAGISGLSAAHFFRKRSGPRARVLIVDNHDDFGGHARRNEFTVDGHKLIGYGGTQSIDTPASYSPVAKGLLTELGIDTAKFHQAYDRQFTERFHLGSGFFFARETFGVDRLVARARGESWSAVIARMPFEPAVRADLARLFESKTNYLASMSEAGRKQALLRMSYLVYLRDHVKLAPRAIPFFQSWTHDLYGVGIDAINALDCKALGFPGFDGLALDNTPAPGQGASASRTEDEPYIFHFPDGNASVARLLVRRLVPGSIPGSTMEDVVTAPCHYGLLDRAGNGTRIRLASTAIRVREDRGGITVTYVRGGKAESVRASRVVLACWHGVIPHLCPELPVEQKTALRYGVKVPLLYTNVALRNWKAIAAARVADVKAPGSYWSSVMIDFPVSLGSYRFSAGPDQPVLLFMERTPCKPGLPEKEQHRIGRNELLATPFSTFEQQIRSQLTRMFGSFGFDAARDIAGITVNRWSHGFTYEYNALEDPIFPAGKAPHEIARQSYGRIAIANADAAAFAYTDAAIDQADRAVRELTRTAAPGG